MRLAFVVLIGTLCACSRSAPEASATNASAEDVARQVRPATNEPATMTPGKWTSKVTIVGVQVPGATAAEQDQMRGKVSEERDYCLSPEEAKKPKENFFAGNHDECRYDHFTMAGGKIDAAMRCSHGTLTQLVNFSGSYSPDSYQLAMDSKVVGGATEMTGMSMSMRVDSRRIGECGAKAD